MPNGVQSTDPAKDAVSLKNMEAYVKDWKIFIDTCSLLHPAANQFWKNIIPLLHQYGKNNIIPLRCIDELEKHKKNKDDRDLAARALNSLKVLQQLISSGYVEVRGEKSDNFADNVFQVVFTKFRMKYKLLLITQDGGLSQDILGLNSSKAVKANPVDAKKINKYGFLSPVVDHGTKPKPESKPETRKGLNDITIDDDDDEIDKFAIGKRVTSIKDEVMPVSHLPSAYEKVLTNYGEIELRGEIGSGGEATTYETNTPFVAKIYKKENITRRKYEKIKLMLSKKIDCPGICYPVAAVYNSKKEFVGVLMPRAKGKELQRGIFLVKQLFLKNFPGWKKRDTVELCVTILEKIKYLHDRNIIMGDINPSNILVVSPKEVYFVDTDSYQIEDFPCPVGTINYTAPEIQRKHFGDFLRTIGNENFAVATLLFMIMLPGKPPYSQQGGEDPIANIIKMDFSYPFGDSSNKKTPDGPWRYIWSHLTYDIKEAFYTTFRKGEEHSTEKTRITVDEWLSLFRHYLMLLDSGKFGQQDKMSEELYPTRHKKNAKFVYISCSLCGKEIPENHAQNGICRDCLGKGEYYKCSKCGKEILYTNYQKYVKGSKRHDTCQECFEKGNMIYSTVRCSGCGRSFEITMRDFDFYKSKGYDLPKKCKSCRSAGKNTYQTYPTRPTTTASSSTVHQNMPPKSKGSFCFISTAVCDYYGLPDNCPELNILRDYRDNWLRRQPDGAQLIAEYYNNAPLIVSRLENSEKYSECCRRLWNSYIYPCIGLINEEKYEECKELYTDMYRYMKSEFLQ